MLRRFFTFFMVSLLAHSLTAQNDAGRLLHHISKSDQSLQVELKWFHKSIVKYDEGCNIYYRTSPAANWTKVNDNPILPDEAIGQQMIAEDSINFYYVEVLNQEEAFDMDPMMIITLFSKSFQSNRYSQYLANYHQFSSPVTSGSVQFMVKYIRFGLERTLSETDWIELNSLSDQPAPFAVEYETQRGKVKFSWKPDDDRFFGVNVYRRDHGIGEFRKVNKNPIVPGFMKDDEGNVNLPEFLYEDTVSEKSQYEYRLDAIGYFENTIAESATIDIVTKDYTPPVRAYSLERQVEGMNTVFLSWQKPMSEDFTEIYVMRSTKSEGPFVPLHKRSLLKHSVNYIDEPEPGKGYYYYIKTVDESGNENRSNMVFVDIPDVTPPSPPEHVTIRSDTGAIHLSWEANTEKDLRGYRIFRGVEDASYNNFILLNAHPTPELSFLDSLPKNAGNKFLYYVVAVDSALNNSKPSEKVSAYLPDVTAPIPPFIYDWSNEDEGTTIRWKASVEDDVSAYHLYRGEVVDGDSSETMVQSLGRDQREFTDATAREGVVYYYYLTAEDRTGNVSGRSNEITIRSREIMKASEISISGEYLASQNRVHLVLPQNDDQLIAKIVYKKNSKGEYIQLSGNVSDNFYEDEEVQPSGEYVYKLAVFFKNGKKIESNELSISTQ